MTFAEIRRGVRPGQEYTVTNAQVPELGPVTVRVGRVLDYAFFVEHGSGESKIAWPPSRYVTLDDDGTLHLCGTGDHIGRPFLTLVPVGPRGQVSN